MPGIGAVCPTQENALCGVSLAQCLSVQQGQGLSSRKEYFRGETDPPLPIFLWRQRGIMTSAWREWKGVKRGW